MEIAKLLNKRSNNDVNCRWHSALDPEAKKEAKKTTPKTKKRKSSAQKTQEEVVDASDRPAKRQKKNDGLYHVRVPSGQSLNITLNGTIVKEVDTRSILFEKVSVGDRIINIDGVDVTCGKDILTVMARTSERIPERFLRLKRAL